MSPANGAGRGIALLGAAFEAGLALLALLVGWWWGHWPLVGIRFTRAAWPEQAQAMLWGAAAALPLLVGLVIVDRYPLGPLRDLKEFLEREVVPWFKNTARWQLALIAVAAGCGEEMLFRGLLQHALAVKIGPPHGTWIALLGASLLFGVCHWLTKTYALLAGLIGVYLGIVFVLTGNLLAPIVAHGLYDFIALLYLVRGNAETP